MKINSLSTGGIFLYSLVGMLVVLVALAILAYLITLVSKAVSHFTAEKTPEAPAPAAAVKPAASVATATPAAVKPAVMATAGELKLCDVDDQTAALLMAVVADQTKIPLSELRYKSIKCLNP